MSTIFLKTRPHLFPDLRDVEVGTKGDGSPGREKENQSLSIPTLAASEAESLS